MKKILVLIATIIITVIFGSAINIAAASETIPFESCHLYGEPGEWNEQYNEGNQKWHMNHMCNCYENVSIYSERYIFVVRTDIGVFTPDCEKIKMTINSIGDYEYYKGLRYID